MKVLNLVTTGDASFYRRQVDVLERKGVECTTIAVGEKAEIIEGPEGSRSTRAYLRFYREVLRRGFDDHDLVHAHYGLVAPFALCQPTRPVVLSFWGSDLMAPDSWVPRLSRGSARLSDAVVVPSPAMSPHLPCRHHLIPFGIDLDVFRPIPRRAARERVGWDTDARIVLFPYTTDREIKNYPRARSIVDRLSVDAELRWISGVPHDEVADYMNASDAVIVTSRREAGPLVLKEAAACNVPAVSTDVGFAREVLDPVENSAVGTTDDELVAALERILRSGERSNGREHVGDAGLDAMGDRLLDLYRSVLERSES